MQLLSGLQIADDENVIHIPLSPKYIPGAKIVSGNYHAFHNYYLQTDLIYFRINYGVTDTDANFFKN